MMNDKKKNILFCVFFRRYGQYLEATRETEYWDTTMCILLNDCF